MFVCFLYQIWQDFGKKCDKSVYLETTVAFCLQAYGLINSLAFAIIHTSSILLTIIEPQDYQIFLKVHLSGTHRLFFPKDLP